MRFSSSYISTPSCRFFLFSGLLGLYLTGCTPTPPSARAAHNFQAPTQGDAENGKLLYDEQCLNCHQLILGQNTKGPQLLGIYGAPAAELTDYDYTATLKTSGFTWNEATLDAYITNPQTALPDTRMRFDGIANKSDRQDIIAYLATL